MKELKTTMGQLPRELDKLTTKDWHFTIGKGKATYHIWALANNSCGLHYCYRSDKYGMLSAKRAVEPNKEVTLHYN